MGIKFIELSVVGDGAFDTCEIEEIYDKDDVLSKAIKLEKKASDLHANLMLAASNLPVSYCLFDLVRRLTIDSRGRNHLRQSLCKQMNQQRAQVARKQLQKITELRKSMEMRIW